MEPPWRAVFEYPNTKMRSKLLEGRKKFSLKIYLYFYQTLMLLLVPNAHQIIKYLKDRITVIFFDL